MVNISLSDSFKPNFQVDFIQRGILTIENAVQQAVNLSCFFQTDLFHNIINPPGRGVVLINPGIFSYIFSFISAYFFRKSIGLFQNAGRETGAEIGLKYVEKMLSNTISNIACKIRQETN